MSATTAVAPYGAWSSPLSAARVAAGGSRLDHLRVAQGTIYWTENLPSEGGRIALYRARPGAGPELVTGAGANVRSRVHEYGGTPYLVLGETILYSQYDDQRLYAQGPDGRRRALTPPGYRYADACALPVTAGAAPAFVCVREDHTRAGAVENCIVRLDLATGGAGEVLHAGADFVAYPRVNPAGNQLAFIRWQHPNLPWDGTELVVAPLGAQGLGELRVVAGGGAESVLEPLFAANGALYFQSDRSDVWNLYRWQDGEVAPLWPAPGEFATPLWSLGQANYALCGEDRLVARFGREGLDQLGVLELQSGRVRPLELPYVSYAHVAAVDERHVVAVAGSVDAPKAIVRIAIDTGEVAIVRRAQDAELPAGMVSIAQPIEYPSAGQRRAHAFYYPPANPNFTAPQGSLPPLLTLVHGGPTAQALPDYAPSIQFWTSRGFAVVDVNYGGSSGYGRRYRERLAGAWGVVDVEDVEAAAEELVRRGLVDRRQTAIRGGSAGGYTVLVALARGRVFRAGADYYGVSDMTALARDTHKFESRYLDKLIGPLPAAQPIYDQRSPLNHLDGFQTPLIVFQGADDPVVPPNQSERIVAALRARGAPVAYLLYPGEGHGFRRAENIVRSLEAELSFYGQVFGFTPPEPLPALTIENLTPPAP